MIERPGPKRGIDETEEAARFTVRLRGRLRLCAAVLGSSSGSACWVNTTSLDGFVGGFVDWVDTANGSRPAAWQRFVDTSAYMVVATEELVFSSNVDWSD